MYLSGKQKIIIICLYMVDLLNPTITHSMNAVLVGDDPGLGQQ